LKKQNIDIRGKQELKVKMNKRSRNDNDLEALDALIKEITVDAYGDDEQLWAFRQAFEDEVTLPSDGFVIGEPVSVVEIGYDGNVRCGLTVQCRREDGSVHKVAASDVVFPEGTGGARYVAAYRRWLGLEPYLPEIPASSRQERRHKAAADDIDLREDVELIVLSVKERTAHCRLLGSNRVITLRTSGLWDVVPGEILTVSPRKQWRYAGRPYLSGEIESTRLDVAALELVPLRLEETGMWDPKDLGFGEGPIEEWAKPIIARGPRPAFEMEQVLPGVDPDNPFSDPITKANDLKEAGDVLTAERIFQELCRSDLRCLDAHAHLGNLVFNCRPKDALRHYEVGFRIGELSLGDSFDGVLLWRHIDNRPFLRCIHGCGLCLWRLGRFDEAERIFSRMLWLNPTDNQGIRFLIEDVRARRAWEEGGDKS
jgi:hypothetical protein